MTIEKITQMLNQSRLAKKIRNVIWTTNNRDLPQSKATMLNKIRLSRRTHTMYTYSVHRYTTYVRISH